MLLSAPGKGGSGKYPKGSVEVEFIESGGDAIVRCEWAEPDEVPGLALLGQKGDQEPNGVLASEAGVREKDAFLNATPNLCNYF